MSAGDEGYQRVAALEDVPDGGCLSVELAGRSLVLVREGREVHALEDRCPHAGAPLSQGFVEGGTITCSWHGWTFEVASGRSADMEDLAVASFPVRVEGGQVFVRV